MDARFARNLLVVSVVALVGVAIALRIARSAHLAAAAPTHVSAGPDDTGTGKDRVVTAESFGSSTGVPSAAGNGAAPSPLPALPPIPTGDFEVAVTGPELQAIVDARYGPFLRSLPFSAADQSRLRELLVERQHAAIDVANAAMVAGLNPIRDLELIRRAIALAEQDVDTDLGRELGSSVLLALHEFEHARAAQNTIDDLTRALASSGDPLRPAQQQHLLRILQQAPAAGVAADINGAIYGRYNRRAEVSASAIAAATDELSPRQLEALRRLAQVTAPDRTAGK
jgi:hypothetical protein